MVKGTEGLLIICVPLISDDQNLKAPRFATYEELNEILMEGFKLYEDIKKGLLESPA
jgi:hypothetical protein